MIAAIYRADTGAIVQSVQGTAAAVAATAGAMGLAYLELPKGVAADQADAFDATHRVQGGQFVAIDA